MYNNLAELLLFPFTKNEAKHMRLIGIDPGTTYSGLVIWNEETHKVDASEGAMPNDELLVWLRTRGWNQWGCNDCETLVVEALSPRGMNLDRNTFATIALTGRLQEIGYNSPLDTVLLERDVIKRTLLGRTNLPGADSKLSTLLKDEAGPKGTKAEPGPCFGVAKHAWQALAAVWAYRQMQREAI